MPVAEFHRTVTAIALSTSARHGFALGGGNALICTWIVDRLTEDVDLFTEACARALALVRVGSDIAVQVTPRAR
jgi:hypothetical protein